MTCGDFEAIIIDVARGTGMAPDEARAHAESCSRCRDRLEMEREVTRALNALAANDAGRQAPPHVEAALAQAFATRYPRRTMRPSRWAYAAAAAVLIAAAGAFVARSGKHREPAPIAAKLPVAIQQPAPPTAPPTVVAKSAAAPRPPARRRYRTARSVRPQVQDVEIATRFIPLTYDDDSNEDEAAPVIRVRLPRTVLATFGFPMSQDRASETVEADVVLNDAGMARAIRFVQPRR